MSVVLSAGLLAAALASAPADAFDRLLPSCEAGDVRLELTADTPGGIPVLCIRPEVSTSFFFDAKLARVLLEGREHFHRLMEAPEGFAVMPSEAMRGMGPLRVTVSFADAAAPASASFLLAVHPALAARQVEVVRHTRPVAFCEQGKREAETRARLCEVENARLRTELRGPGGLWGMRESGFLDTVVGVKAEDLTSRIRQRPGSTLNVSKAWTYRTYDRVAVELIVENTGTWPWKAAGAALRALNGEELTPLPLKWTVSILPGQKEVRVMVEVSANDKQALGSHTLTLWSAEGRSFTVENVTFPK